MTSSLEAGAGLLANPWLAHRAAIDAIQREIPAVATYRLRLLDPAVAAAYRFQPGQFNMLYVPGCGESAISLSGPAGGDGRELVHTIRVVGRVTGRIADMRVGDEIGVRGPFGRAWPIEECLGRDVILVGGGIGLAPLRPAIYALLRRRSEFARIALLVGARSPELLLYADELAQWDAQGIDVQLTVDQADASWHGSVGVVPLLIDRLNNFRPSESIVLMCGPEVMMHYSAASAMARGIARESLWLSLERNMQCAVGLCGHCQLGPAFVCRDGPVFRYDRVESFLAVRDL